jgi:hypothetical protein
MGKLGIYIDSSIADDLTAEMDYKYNPLHKMLNNFERLKGKTIIKLLHTRNILTQNPSVLQSSRTTPPREVLKYNLHHRQTTWI